MDDDWDLHAVVRGCAAARSPTPTTHTTPLPNLPSNSPFHADQIQNSSFHGRMDGADHFQGLHEIYQEFIGSKPPPPTTTDAAVMPVPVGHVFQPHQEIFQIAPLLHMNMQRFPAAIPQHIRPRRRKNQQTKFVRQMTQEELSADSWAWRKYGQKPIKGSPYPRNYYRCSTSKGCAARKQVERSPDDAGIFVVSYSGEHTHARPTHRSSLAGSTRTKFVVKNNNTLLLHRGSASSSSPSTSSLSPATPAMDGDPQNDDVQMSNEEDAAGDDDTENLINDEDDMFRGFQDSDHSSGGGSGLLSSPPWSPAGSAAAFNGGGGC